MLSGCFVDFERITGTSPRHKIENNHEKLEMDVEKQNSSLFVNAHLLFL